MKQSKLSMLLIIGATLVAAVRYVGLFANSEGWRIEGWLWDWTVALSGLGMSVLEGVATWYMWQAWSRAQKNADRNLLTGIMVASGITLLVMVSPYIQASSNKQMVSDVLQGSAMWVWSVANALALTLVMAGVGMCDKLASVDARQAQGEATDVEQVVGAMLANFEAKIGATLGGFASVADVQQAFDRIDARLRRLQHAEQPAQPDVAEVAQPAQLGSGLTWSADNLRNVLAQHPDISATDARNLFANPPSRQAVASAMLRARGAK